MWNTNDINVVRGIDMNDVEVIPLAGTCDMTHS